MNSPPHQHRAATNPALRGPARSSQCPNIAAADPRKTKNNVYVQPSIETGQSQVVENTRSMKPTPSHLTGCCTPIQRGRRTEPAVERPGRYRALPVEQPGREDVWRGVNRLIGGHGYLPSKPVVEGIAPRASCTFPQRMPTVGDPP